MPGIPSIFTRLRFWDHTTQSSSTNLNLPNRVDRLGLNAAQWEQFKWIILYNLTRDVIWGYLTASNAGWTSKTDDPNEQVYAQWIYSTAAMVAVLLLKYICTKHEHMTFETDSTAIAAASLGILGWDAAQRAAMNSLLRNGATPFVAEMGSAFAPGMAEGPIQWGTNAVLSRCINTFPKIFRWTKSLIFGEEGQTFRAAIGLESWRDVRQTAQILSLGGVWSATIGILPGDVWQIVSAGTSAAGLDPLAQGALIAFCTGVANVVTGLPITAMTIGINSRYANLARQEAILSASTGHNSPSIDGSVHINFESINRPMRMPLPIVDTQFFSPVLRQPRPVVSQIQAARSQFHMVQAPAYDYCGWQDDPRVVIPSPLGWQFPMYVRAFPNLQTTLNIGEQCIFDT